MNLAQAVEGKEYTNRNKVRKEQSKKPLVITARIKRLYTTMLILHLVCIVPMIIFYNDINLQVFYVFMGLLVYINPFVIWLSNIINKPIEKMVFNHYKRMAKNKLKAMPSLMKVGITGSYGKTSTKNALNDILNVKFNSFATEKSFNTMNGLMISINNKLDSYNNYGYIYGSGLIAIPTCLYFKITLQATSNKNDTVAYEKTLIENEKEVLDCCISDFGNFCHLEHILE